MIRLSALSLAAATRVATRGASRPQTAFATGRNRTLAYSGTIDDNPNWHPDPTKGTKNLVRAALADLKAGRAVSIAKTRADGCGVKYMN